jgi:hypothetical protein
MPKIVRQKSTGKTVYRQSPDFKKGIGIKNALLLGYDKNDLEEIVLSQQEYDDDIKEEYSNLLVINSAKKTISEKYKGKKKSDITDSDALEWIKLKMVQELGINV